MSDYYTYRIRVANRDHVQVEIRNPQNEDTGQPSGVFNYKEASRQEIDRLIEAAQHKKLEGPQVRELGENLFNALFDTRLRQTFVDLYHTAVHVEKKLLRLELDIDEQSMPEVAALPWEFMCLPLSANLGTVWLATAPNLIFSRRRAQWHAPQPIQLGRDEKLRIAVAVAAPANLPPVVSHTVVADLQQLAEQQADRITLLPVVNPANPESIDAVLAQNPHIFHFIGHGRLHNENGLPVGQIALVDDFDDALWVDADYFSELLNQHRPGVVLLQACEGGMLSTTQAFTGLASRVVQQNIPVVVAMQYEVSNITASRFARRFYQQLAEDDPVDRAAQYGRRTIALGPTLYKTRDFATPVIFMRVRDGRLFQRQPSAAAVRPVDQPTPEPVIDTSSHTPAPTAADPVDLPQLARQISEHFNDNDLQELCFDLNNELREFYPTLNLDYENLPGNGKSAKARELVQFFQRRGMVLALRQKCHAARPHLAW